MVGQEDYHRALKGNAAWAQHIHSTNPNFLPELAKKQTPPILWIGCSDSRIPETTITGLQPGDIFTHRNIANIVNLTDLSVSSVIEYAVAHVLVKHVFLVGHTACGGCAAALGNSKIGPIDVWLQPLREIRAAHWSELKGLSSADQAKKLAELNVIEGVKKIKSHPSVIAATTPTEKVQVHGLIYDLATGTLSDLNITENEQVLNARKEAFLTS